MTEETCASEIPTTEKSSQLAIFSVPSLLNGEATAAYEELLARVLAEINPSDIFEEIWVREIVDLVWEIFRLRRMKRNLLAAAELDATARVCVPLLLEIFKKQSVKKRVAIQKLLSSQRGEWTERNPHLQRLDKIWKSLVSQMDPDRVTAQAFVQQLDNVERIDRLTAIAQGRRNGILREIAHHRANFGRTLSEKIQQIEETEFETIEAKAISPMSAGNEKAA